MEVIEAPTKPKMQFNIKADIFSETLLKQTTKSDQIIEGMNSMMTNIQTNPIPPSSLSKQELTPVGLLKSNITVDEPMIETKKELINKDSATVLSVG